MSKKHKRRPRALFVQPDPDHAPDGLVNAARLRAEANRAGRCPACGAVFEIRQVEPRIYAGVMRHEDGCPCLTDEQAQRAGGAK